jgi:hypothetical protein
MGVRAATIPAEVPTGTLAGAESCRVKLLVMVNAAEALLDGSAMLCAAVHGPNDSRVGRVRHLRGECLRIPQDRCRARRCNGHGNRSRWSRRRCRCRRRRHESRPEAGAALQPKQPECEKRQRPWARSLRFFPRQILGISMRKGAHACRNASEQPAKACAVADGELSAAGPTASPTTCFLLTIYGVCSR